MPLSRTLERPSSFYSIGCLLLGCLVLLSWGCSTAPTPVPLPSPENPLCTPAPQPPQEASDDWREAVHGNCFSNLDRLELWIGGFKPLRNGQSPEKGFRKITPGSIGTTPRVVIVLVHGWAPGYRENVLRAGGKIKWWSDATGNSSGVWPSAWAWVPTNTTDPVLSVTQTGVFQEFQKPDPHNGVFPVVLGYSWTDESATDGSFVDVDQVYQSEAYTNLNGIRLADALEEALAPEFWTSPGNSLHIVGHSHGSKVATIATLTLQNRDRRVDHLTVLDSPESEITLAGNGANLLGIYLEELSIATASIGELFVDNYVSEFGAGFEGVQNLVEVMLDPSQVYGLTDAGDKHSYSAAWYGGAAAAVSRLGNLSPIGLDWPPSPAGSRKEALNQKWSGGVTEREQWILTPGPAIDEVRRFTTPSQTVTQEGHYGNVMFTNQVVTLKALSGTSVENAYFRGGYRTSEDQYGLAFDVEWSNSAPGGYVVFTAEAPETREQEVLLVLDGKSMPDGKHLMSFNSDVSSLVYPAEFRIFYVPAAKNSAGVVTVSNFRKVISTCERNCI